MKIPIKEAQKLGIAYQAITERVLSAILNGDKFVELSRFEYQEALNQKYEYEEKAKALNKCAKLNNRGIAYERAGKVKSAIRVYEENIELGYPAHHAFKRLMVLYHKAKDYENEERVIHRALEVFGSYREYEDRFNKLKKYL